MSSVRPMVLHIVESYGSGVATALDRYMAATPDLSHHLLRRDRIDGYPADDEVGRFASIHSLGDGQYSSIMAVHRLVRRLRPDVVHAHSSFAGLYARVALAPSPHRRIVYSPHCFSFERQDVLPWTRAGFRLAERLLTRRTDVVAACSMREFALARELSSNVEVVYVPNVAEVSGDRTLRPGAMLSIHGMGRVSTQKDPLFFVGVVEELRRRGQQFRPVWLGGGDARLVEQMKRLDIHVSGWMPHREALDCLATASVYVHTAAWEGAPMAILEAHSLGLPIVGRRIPALQTAPNSATAETTIGVADIVERIWHDALAAAENVRDWGRYLANNNAHAQRTALLQAYGLRNSNA